MMVKNAFTVAVIALAGVAMAACGGSDKQEATTPDPGPVEPSTDSEPVEQPDMDSEHDTSAGGDTGPDLTEVIFFEFDSSTLSDQARRQLQQNAEWLRADSSRRITIEGHTDEVGTPEYNLALGERRAQSAQQYLIQLGIDDSRIEIVTFGEERPMSEDDSENRRSVFVPLN